ncbi:MAG: RNA polymerase factor sigma-54 [Muribaculaceae bacterium]|nr:RNA polymerase factor sigma-54 [Muribaculaceae bacterium]
MNETNDFQQIQKLSQEMVLKQKASQMQVMLGQLIEMNDDEIKDRIEMELDDNPALEEADSNVNDYENDGEDNQNNDDPFDTAFTQADDDDYDRNDDGLSYIQTKRRQNFDTDIYRPPVINEASMYEVLMNQIRERDLDERQLLIAEYIIGEIDDDGLLRRPITSICGNIISKENEFVTPQEVQDVLEIIQDLEPAGIGATSTRECILLQIEDMKGENIDIAQIAHAIVDKHFEEYERHHYDKILNALNIDEDTFLKADKIIKRTNPRPGNIFSSGERMSNAQHITPDFVISNEDGKLTLTLVNDIPELQISESYEIEYQRIAKRASANESDNDILIKRQYERATSFIEMLKMRQEKLYNIMKAIMLKQQEFFITGDPMTLKPLVLNDIADMTGYDVSTISRARQNKYVDTNWGIFDLKYFFGNSLDDNETSSVAIKEIIKELVENEDKKKPLSDEKLCNILQERGYNIKRRTVAKYRENLLIPVARQRKTL